MPELPLDIATDLSPDQLTDLAHTLEGFPGWVRQRGQQVADEDRVSTPVLDDQGVVASVRGTHVVAARWTFDARAGVSSTCSCPGGPRCKHAYALGALVIAAAVASHRMRHEHAADLFPDSWLGPRRRGVVARGTAAAALETMRTQGELHRLGSSQHWEAFSAASTLLLDSGVWSDAVPRAAIESVLTEPDPELRALRLARLITEAKGTPPAMLAAYLARPELSERLAQRERAQLLDSLQRWPAQSETPHRLRVVIGLIAIGHEVEVTLEARLSSARLDDQPRSTMQLEQLAAELRRDARLLTPPQARLLRALLEGDLRSALLAPRRARIRVGDLEHLLDRVGDSPFLTWDPEMAEDLARRAGITPGARVRVASEGARIEPGCTPGDASLELGLQVLLPGQPLRALVEIIHLPAGLGEQPWSHGCVVADGRVYRVTEEPPADVMRHFRETGAVRVGAGEVGVLQSLAARFHSVGAALREHAVIHPVRPVVCLDLRDSDWLQVRAFAFSGRGDWRPGVPLISGEVLFEWLPDQRWVRLDEARADAVADLPDGTAEDEPAVVAEPLPPRVPSVSSPEPPQDGTPWLHLPDPAAVGPVESWLQLMGLRTASDPSSPVAPTEPDREAGRWLKLSRRGVESAARAWDARPRGVRYLGNRNADHLFAGAARRAPSVRVESSGLDWFGVSLEWSAEAATLTPDDLARLRASREPFVRLKSGWVRREAAEEADALANALADLGIELSAGPQRVHVATLAQADARSLTALEALGGDALAAVRLLRERVAAFRGVPELPPPPGLRAELRSYQQRGFEFLTWAGETGLGAVLADDMGLGKTVQALAWLEHLRVTEPEGGPALVVCPASVVHNWVREAQRFTPGMRVLALTAGEERTALREAAHDHDLLVTTYALLRRDLAFWRDQPLRAAILDEAQHIKNPATAVAKAALELRARHRLALTGTPMENRLLDLWSLSAFTNPGMLGTRTTFLARFDGTDVPAYSRRLLSARLRPVLLRRLKSQVAQELPDRIEERLDCEMTPGQRRLYLAERTRTREALERAANQDPTLQRQRFEVLSALTRLRQICCHPALAGGRADLGSGKFEALHELLEPLLAEGRKVLVFSQFVECLKLVERELSGREVPYHVLTGATTRREQVVQAFETDPRACVFLISLKAGGTGLNLTAASDVVLLDPWWNPAVEAQAIDRTHRIGQSRTVIAYRLIARGTVEDRIAELQERKKALIRDVLAEEAFARTLTADDLRFLLEAEPEVPA